MKILFFTPYLPGPPVFGGQRRIHGLMRALARSHEVSLLSLVGAGEPIEAGIRDAARFCRQVITVPERRQRVAGVEKRVRQMLSMVSPQSWEQQCYLRPVLQRALSEHLAQHHYDVINTEFVFMGGYQFRLQAKGRPTRLVLDEHNVEYDLLRRMASGSRLDRKLYNTVNYVKLRREELAAWARFDGVAFTSERDAELARSEVPSIRTAVVPNGVDVEGFQPRQDIRPVPMTLLFFGAINYFPNTDAVLFFVNEVLPSLLRRYPDLTLRIVGPGVPPEISALANERVQVVGFVDDLQAEIARAAVVVAPLRIGGGTRLKIVEAMAMGKPIVATTLGAEGIDIKHGHDILLADQPDDLAREVGRVLEDAAFAQRLGAAARKTAEDRYSWEAAAQKMTAFYESL